MPKTNPKTFFESPQGAAIFKHGWIGRYLTPWASKVGSRSAGGRVAYLDTHAGAGSYDDGTPGSPALAARTAEKISSYRQLECFYVEENADMVEALAKVLAPVEHTHEVLQGRIEDHLDHVLGRAAGIPLFAFVDPFGLAIPFNDMTKLLARPAKTELLLNFSVPALHRTAGLKGQNALDRTVGGDWWKEHWSSLEGQERDYAIVDEYRKRLAKTAGGWMSWIIPVSDRWDGPPSYYLIFMTQHWDGVWTVIDCVSNAREEFRKWSAEQAGQLDVEGGRDDQWIEHVAQNLSTMLAEQGAFRLEREVNAIYGSTLGFARLTHVRKAWDLLVQRGVAKERPKLSRGVQLKDLTIYPA